jgi:hypothetical protein
MSELMRFRVARAPKRSLPLTSEAFVPLYLAPDRSQFWQRIKVPAALPLGDFLPTLLSSEDGFEIATNYVAGPQFVGDASYLSSPAGQLDLWLSSKENRPSPAELLAELGEAPGEILLHPEWRADRVNVADSLVAAMVAGVDTSITAFLHRLMLVIGLVEILGTLPERFKTPEDVFWALRWRNVLLPSEFTTYLQRTRSVLSRRPGRADLFVVQDEWIRYEAGEIADIENVLPGELKERKHIRLDETEQTTTQETDRSQTNERDTQTTDRFDLHDEASTDTNLAVHIDGKVDASGSYGPMQVSTHIGGDLNYSQEQSQKHATNQASETIARAVTRVEEQVRQVRTTRSLTRITETNKHSINNIEKTPVVGIYRWVEKIQRLQLFRYPNRYLLEFEVPEPGAWWRWLQDQGKNKGVLTQDPGPFTIDGKDESAANPRLQASNISDKPDSDGYYLKLGARYATVGLTPPPQNKVVAVSLKRESIDDPGTAADPKEKQGVKFATDATMAVPDGYQATDWSAFIQSFSSPFVPSIGATLFISVGGGGAIPVQVSAAVTDELKSGQVGNITTGTIPVAVMTVNECGFAININVTCEPTPEAIAKWQINAYDQIAQAYFAVKRQHDEEIAALSVRQGVEISGSSPERNKEIIRDELKKLVIEMLTGAQFKGRAALRLTEDGKELIKPPQVDLLLAPKVSSEILFLEQAFEWENLTYIFYPYYWAGATRWPELADLNSDDADFARFCRAGSARIVVPARPGFEEQVNIYTHFGVLWGGGPVPSTLDENYISVAEEIKAQQQAPRDGERGESWEVRLPTTLVWLENNAGLPTKAKPHLDEPPGNIL